MKDLSLVVSITHINVRKEGEDHDINACDIKFSTTVPASVVDDMMCGGINDGDAIKTFWLENESGDPRFMYMPGLSINRVFPNINMTLMDQIEAQGCKLQKISWSPRQNRMASMEFTVTAKHLSEANTAKLIGVMYIPINLSLVMPQGDMFDSNGEPKKDEKDSGDGTTAVGAGNQ